MSDENEKLLKALKSCVPNYSSLKSDEIVTQLSDPKVATRLAKAGVNDAKLNRLVIYLKEHKPSGASIERYLKTDLL